MNPENNLIKDYCIQNKVAIVFGTLDQLNMILGLFDQQRVTQKWHTGAITFYREEDQYGNTTTQRICGPTFTHWQDQYTLITAEEFFTLALPNRSILEYIK